VARGTKGSRARPIIVDNHRLRWRIEWLPTDPVAVGPIMRIVVFSLAGGSPRLLAEQRTEETILHLKESSITPRHVEGIVRSALQAGWNPESRGADFHLSGFASIMLEVDGFRIEGDRPGGRIRPNDDGDGFRFTPNESISPELRELLLTAQDDPAATGPVGDWLEEQGHPQAAALARFRYFLSAYVLVALPESDRTAWLRIGDWLIGTEADYETCYLRLEHATLGDRRGRHIAEMVVDPSVEEHDRVFARLFPRRPK
jgi:hypothetical protein